MLSLVTLKVNGDAKSVQGSRTGRRTSGIFTIMVTIFERLPMIDGKSSDEKNAQQFVGEERSASSSGVNGLKYPILS